MTTSQHKNLALPMDAGQVVQGTFLARPNRFLMQCETPTGTVTAFLPNPGRLSELLLPRTRVHLLHTPVPSGKRATAYTVLAVENRGRPIMLHTHWCNVMARTLFDRGLVPGFETARVVRQEVCVGKSRFDFLLEDGDGPWYIEVKSCTLFSEHVALFPDAVTDRGRRHLLELAEIARTGAARCAVLFLVQTDQAQFFMPDYHMDLAFAQAMLSVRDAITIAALPVAWNQQLRFMPGEKLLDIPWEHIEREARDQGAYLLLLRLDAPETIAVGSLGALPLDAGYYLYVGSAMNGLNARLARHQRKRKRMHWHVDYLRDRAMLVDLIPIRGSERIECTLARDIRALADRELLGFGCSDCACPSHLFYLREHPYTLPDFHACVLRHQTRLF